MKRTDFLFLLCLIATTGFAQPTSPPDKPLLYDPRPSEQDTLRPADWKHSLELRKGKFRARFNGKMSEAPYSALDQFLARNKAAFQSKQLCVIHHDEATYPEVLLVLEALTKRKIRFKLAGRPEKASGPAAPPDRESFDSSYFMVTLQGSGCLVCFRSDTTRLAGCKELSELVGRLKPQLDKDKIVISAAAQLPYSSFKCYLDAFSGNGFYQFKLLPVE